MGGHPIKPTTSSTPEIQPCRLIPNPPLNPQPHPAANSSLFPRLRALAARQPSPSPPGSLAPRPPRPAGVRQPLPFGLPLHSSPRSGPPGARCLTVSSRSITVPPLPPPPEPVIRAASAPSGSAQRNPPGGNSDLDFGFRAFAASRRPPLAGGLKLPKSCVPLPFLVKVTKANQ